MSVWVIGFENQNKLGNGPNKCQKSKNLSANFVVYFDLCLGTAHSKWWSECAFSVCFMPKSQKRKQENRGNFEHKNVAMFALGD